MQELLREQMHGNELSGGLHLRAGELLEQILHYGLCGQLYGLVQSADNGLRRFGIYEDGEPVSGRVSEMPVWGNGLLPDGNDV